MRFCNEGQDVGLWDAACGAAAQACLQWGTAGACACKRRVRNPALLVRGMRAQWSISQGNSRYVADLVGGGVSAQIDKKKNFPDSHLVEHIAEKKKVAEPIPTKKSRSENASNEENSTSEEAFFSLKGLNDTEAEFASLSPGFVVKICDGDLGHLMNKENEECWALQLSSGKTTEKTESELFRPLLGIGKAVNLETEWKLFDCLVEIGDVEMISKVLEKHSVDKKAIFKSLQKMVLIRERGMKMTASDASR